MTKYKVGIAAKISIPFVVISLVTLLLMGASSFWKMNEALLKSLDEKSQILTSNLAIELGDPLSMGEYDRMQMMLDAAQKSDPDLFYAVAVSPDGKVDASTDVNLRNQLLTRDDFERGALKVTTLIRRKTSDDSIYEMVIPIKGAGGQAGFLRTGFSTDRVQAAVSQAEMLIAAIGAVSLVLGIIVYGAVVGTVITRPIEGLVAVAKKIAVGDLEVATQPEVVQDDEIGLLTRAFQTMSTSLRDLTVAANQVAAGDLRVHVQPRSDRDMLGNAFASMLNNLSEATTQISKAVKVLSGAVSEITESVSQSTSLTAETASAMAETAAVVDQLRSTAQRSNAKAKEVSVTAIAAVETAEAGNQATVDTIACIQRIDSEMGPIYAGMARLSKRAQAITEIVSTVDDIFRQLRLLSVNATIEASKAGEAGRGFAVVAYEVKELSKQAKEATTHIQEILVDIQEAAREAMLAVESGKQAAESAVSQSGQAKESIILLGQCLSESEQAANQIARSSEENLVGVAQVVAAIADVKAGIDSNVTAIHKAEIAVNGLKHLEDVLGGLVTRYKLPDQTQDAVGNGQKTR